ncbi:two-partner secretion domain-containing protein [Budvicia aquatica]|uniref:two-partner secretion domain-containing protein n=1 Tax=Budvicia aquatica TaxID=82979 RepID=UPI002085A4D6|nr:hemagglutinin repeat-containing protein [Budvicia aquatica]GKX53107.1 adhesin [Budvicia aquatica]
MNKHLYRIVFNKARGMLMVVPEIAGTHRPGANTSGAGHTLNQLIAGLSPLTLLTSLALGLMTISLPASADIVADKNAPGNQQPTVINSGNGTPQVNIQTPSAGGVSRNTYTQFDVDQRGAILNNASAPTNTQLGGYVAGNPWLAKGEAKIILNEVNSRDPSKLNGYIEVAGKKAQVVIANPAGITCDGCGFINANRATLTTGTPIINNGNLDGYNVTQGTITVQGKGLDSSQQDYTDIIARSVDVNAGLWANELSVVAGKNKVSADTQHIEKLGSNDVDSPQFSVDVAALGGMYANSIRLVGTENGVGVRNAGTMGAQAGSVVVTADGRIVNSGTISSAQNLHITTQQSLTNSGTVYGKNDVQLSAQGDIANLGTGQVGANGHLNITTQGSLTNQGTLAADGSATVTSRRGMNNSGTLSSGQGLALSASSIDNSGTLQSQGPTTIKTPGYFNSTAGSKIISSGFLSIDSGDWLTSYATVYSASGATFSSKNALFNGGAIDAGLGISLTASHITNAGTIYGGGDTQLRSQSDLINSGTIGSDGNITLSTLGEFSSNNTIHGKGQLWLNAGGNVTHGGTLAADRGLTLTTPGMLNNTGTLYSKGGLWVTANSTVTNSGSMGADGELNLSTYGALFNNQTLYGKGQTTLTIGGNVTNHGVIGSDSNLTLTTQNALQNGSTIYAKGNTTISASGAVTNGGTLGADRDLTLTTGGNLLNNGTLYSQGAGKYHTDGSFINNNLLRSENTLLIDAQGNILNEADIFALAGLNLSSGQNIDNHAQLYSGAALSLYAAGNITNTATLASLSNMVLSASLFSNANSALLAAGVQSNGQLAQNGGITINVAQSASLQGQTIAAGELNVDANGIHLADAQVSTGAMTLQAHGGGVNADRSQIYVNNALNANTTGHWSNLGGKVYAGEINLNAASLTNDALGEISAQSTKITLSNTLSNRGLIDGLLTRLQAAQIDNYGTGRIYGTWLGLQADIINNREENGTAATLAGRETLDIGAGVLNNYTHSLIFSGGNMSIGRWLDDNGNATGMGSVLNNHSATVEALGDLRLSMGLINNINDHFLTEFRVVSQESILEYGMNARAQHYSPDEVSFTYYGNDISVLHTPDGVSDDYYTFNYVRTTQENVITETDPAKILSGGNLLITADTVNNDKSQIVAGNALNIIANTLNNTEITGTRIISEQGPMIHYYPTPIGGKKVQGHHEYYYSPADVYQNITLKASETVGNTQPNGSGASIADRQDGNQPSGGTHGISIDRVDTQLPDMTDVSVVTRPPSMNIALPNASLYKINPAVGGQYLVETDPKFTNYKKWLGSDYMTSLVKSDPNNVFKRLGDGFYEQQLIRDQIISLTGQRYLSGYADDEEQFKALMNNGVAFAEKYTLSLGVALTSEQMANLTSDIVWMVSREVTLADGAKQTVLVPQVYAMIKPQDIDSNGALLAGKQVGLQLTGDMVNQGRILAGDKLSVLAQNIQNLGGNISGANVMLAAHNDINNIGGLMQANDSLSLKAGHDINITTTTNHNEKGGTNSSSHTNINQVGVLSVINDNGSLSLSSGNDINLTAALISNAGKNGDTTLSAGNDLNMNTVTTAQQRDYITASKNGSRKEAISQDIGTQITGGGNVTLVAKNDINAKAAHVVAEGQLAVVAGNDIHITAGQSTDHVDSTSKSTSRSGMTKTVTEKRVVHDVTLAESSNFSGDTVLMNAGHDLRVEGSQVTSTHDMALHAGNDLTLTSAEEQQYDMEMVRKKKTGLMSSGGIGVTYGKIDEKSTNTTHRTTQLASTVGSTEGNVTLSAGNNLAIKGADVIAQNDISLTGKNVSVESVENQTSMKDVYERKQTGVTVALSGAAGSALNAAVTQAKQAQESNDSKVKALQEIKAALSVVQAIQAMNMAPDGNDGYVGISISGGTQITKSETNTDIRAAQGSMLAAGNNLSITATGSGEKGADGDIFIKGSAIHAGNDITLEANRDVMIIAAANTQQTDSESKSYGGNAGISFGWGGGKNGIRLFADANFSQSNMNADGLYWTESTLDAGNKLSITSGRDTSLIGAQASGESVFMDVGRDLTLKSLQDTDDYSYESVSLNISGSYGSGFDASLGMTMDKMDSTWASVNEQTGISAGKGGYDITVGNHTQLDGAVIASEATADKNNLDTGTLGWNDIKNKAEFDVSHVSMSIGSGGGAPLGFPGVPGVPIIVAYGEKDSSTTHSAIAEGNITIRDKEHQQQDISTISNDTQNANNVLDKIFDAEKEQNKLEAIQLAGQIGQQITDISMNFGKIKAEKEAEDGAKKLAEALANDPDSVAQARENLAKKDISNPTSAQLSDAINSIAYNKIYESVMKDYGTGSDLQQAVQSANAALQGLIGGNLGAAAAGASAPYLAEAVKNLTTNKDTKEVDKLTNAIGHAIVGALVAQASGNNALAGAAGATSGELVSQLIVENLYPGKGVKDLTEAERKTVSDLSTIAAGAIGGITSGDLSGAATGAGAGQNAVNNNNLLVAVAEGGALTANACFKVALCRNKVIEAGLGALIGVGATTSAMDNLSETDRMMMIAIVTSGDPELMSKLTDGQRAAYEELRGNKGSSNTGGNQLPPLDLTGGKLSNPIVDQQGGTALVNPDKSGEQGSSNTGNQEGTADVGNVPGTPIPEQNGQDNIYISESGDAGKGNTGQYSGDFSRPLTADDLGVKGSLSQLDGTYSIRNGTATVRVDMIEGQISNPLRIIDNLINNAKSSGATTLKIEGTIANPDLLRVLERRYGMQTSGANDTITIKIK